MLNTPGPKPGPGYLRLESVSASEAEVRLWQRASRLCCAPHTRLDLRIDLAWKPAKGVREADVGRVRRVERVGACPSSYFIPPPHESV